MSEFADRIRGAVDLGLSYGGIDGGHHKMWTIDQMLRVLLADEYESVIKAYKAGSEYQSDMFKVEGIDEAPTYDEDGVLEDMYNWDEGIAP